MGWNSKSIPLILAAALGVSAQENEWEVSRAKADRLHEEGKFREAARVYEQHLRKNPEDAEALLRAAVCYLRDAETGRPRSLERAYELAASYARVSPDSPRADLLLGQTFLRLGVRPPARHHLARALAAGQGGPSLDAVVKKLGAFEIVEQSANGEWALYRSAEGNWTCVLSGSGRVRAAYETEKAELAFLHWLGRTQVYAWKDPPDVAELKRVVLRLEEARAPFVRALEFVAAADERPEHFLSRAAEEFEEAWKLVPEHRGALQSAAVCRYRLALGGAANRGPALELAERLLREDPRNLAGLKIAGLIHLHARNHERAQRLLTEAAAIRPNDADLTQALRRIQEAGRDRLKEREAGTWKGYSFTAYEGASPGVFEVVFRIDDRFEWCAGLYARGLGEGKAAQVLERTTIDGEPQNMKTYGERVASYDEFKADLWKALDCLEDLAPNTPAELDRAIGEHPDRAELRFQRALLRLEAGKLAEALRDCDEGIRANPTSPEGLRVRSMVHERRGRLKEAIADLEGAIRIAGADWPHSKAAREKLAELRKGGKPRDPSMAAFANRHLEVRLAIPGDFVFGSKNEEARGGDEELLLCTLESRDGRIEGILLHKAWTLDAAAFIHQHFAKEKYKGAGDWEILQNGEVIIQPFTKAYEDGDKHAVMCCFADGKRVVYLIVFCAEKVWKESEFRISKVIEGFQCGAAFRNSSPSLVGTTWRASFLGEGCDLTFQGEGVLQCYQHRNCEWKLTGNRVEMWHDKRNPDYHYAGTMKDDKTITGTATWFGNPTTVTYLRVK